MIEIPKINYMSFSGYLKKDICVYSFEFENEEKGVAGWYDYDISNFLESGEKIINKLGKESFLGEKKLLERNMSWGVQCIKVIFPCREVSKACLLDVIAYTHYKEFDFKNYEFIYDFGEYKFKD